MKKIITQLELDFGDYENEPVSKETALPLSKPKVIYQDQNDATISLVEDERKTYKTGKRGRPRKWINALDVKPKAKRGRKSLEEIEQNAAFINVPDDEVLFSKQYYPIRDVAAMFNTTTSHIRLWENTFDNINPRKNRKGDRFFTPQNIKTLQFIHFLIREKKLTLKGAADYIKTHKNISSIEQITQQLQNLKLFLLELKAHL